MRQNGNANVLHLHIRNLTLEGINADQQKSAIVSSVAAPTINSVDAGGKWLRARLSRVRLDKQKAGQFAFACPFFSGPFQ
jgi:hypothetical protein